MRWVKIDGEECWNLLRDDGHLLGAVFLNETMGVKLWVGLCIVIGQDGGWRAFKAHNGPGFALLTEVQECVKCEIRKWVDYDLNGGC